MSRLEKVQKHNKNVMDAVNVLSSEKNISYTYHRQRRYHRLSFKELLRERFTDDYLRHRYESNLVKDKEKLMQKFCYVKKLSDVVHLKKKLVKFYNELSVFYERHASYADYGMTVLDREKRDVAEIPEILKETEQKIKELEEFVNSKDADYEKCVELYEQYKKCEADLHATQSYVVQERQAESYTDYETHSEMVWDVCLRMPRTEYRSVPVTKTRYVTKNVTKYRPDTQKIEAAKKAIPELKRVIAKFPTYDRNVQIYNSYETIDELKEKFEDNNKHLEETNDVQAKIVSQIKSDLKVAKQLQEILNREKEIIEAFIKNPKKYQLRDVSELPEREF